MHSNHPLVSIVVIAYNSDQFILENLNSLGVQTYQNIEIIISDDGSTDQTVEICEKWKIDNRDRCVNIHIIVPKENTGIVPNLNRGIKASKGKYIKYIAGDDLLMPNCIEDFTAMFEADENIKVAAGQTKIFFNNDQNQFHIWPKDYQFPESNADQRLEILKANFVYNASMFLRTDFLNSIGNFDEDYAMIEDYPFDFKVIYLDEKIYLLKKVVVMHRINFYSTTRPAKLGKFVNKRSHHDGKRFMEKEIFPTLLKNKMFLWYFMRKSKIVLYTLIVNNGNSSNGLLNKFYLKLLTLNKIMAKHLLRIEKKLK